jgi:hypothetical protein
MRSVHRIRPLLLGLALMHLLPVTHHGRELLAAPSLGDAWKTVGASAAVLLLAMPTPWLMKLVGRTLNRGRTVSVLATLLAIAHVVPAADHLPKLLASPNWGDAWRGIGAALAVTWFASPRALQLRLVRAWFRPLRAPRGVRPLAGEAR